MAHPVSMSVNQLAQITTGAVIVPTTLATLRVEGPGAVTCLQGILTNDVEHPGTGHLGYGAMLTPKGMIVADMWTLRDDAGFTLLLESSCRDDALTLFHKQLPPRLATITDRTADRCSVMLLGQDSLRLLAGILDCPLPEPGQIRALKEIDGSVAVPEPGAPWKAGVVLPRELSDRLVVQFCDGGGERGSEDARTAARVLAGWARHQIEIDQKTLPQEVRFDEIGGVSYAKGCYVGQETVARVHFRGHPNRFLRGLIWTAQLDGIEDEVHHEGKPVGKLGSVLQLPNRALGIGLVRKEIRPGMAVRIGPIPARVVALPFKDEDVSGVPSQREP